MPASSVNNRIFTGLVLALLYGFCPGAGWAGDNFSDDARIKADFEARLGTLFEAGGVPTGSETLKQLHRQNSGPYALPATPSVVSSPVVSSPVATPSVATPPVVSPSGSPAASTASMAATYDRARRATLILGHLYHCGKCDKYHARLAGGVLISPDGLALTNYHVLDIREGIVFGAMTTEGKVFVIAEVLAASKENDIALIRLRDAADLPHVPLRDTVATGDELFVISHPDGFFHSFTKGYLSRKYLTPKEKVPRLQLTADFAKGSSGAGIFNTAGELVGLATATNSIYYGEEGDSPGHLQMVIKSGVPISSISQWFAEPPEQ